MNKSEWREKIIETTTNLGTFKEEFYGVIDALAEILEQRDRAYQDFLDSGADIVVIKISDRGAKNESKNPRLVVWSELNNQALAYWRELGLTPTGLKRINEMAIKGEEKESALEKALREIGGQELERGNQIRGVNKGRRKAGVRRAKTGG